MVRDVLDEYMCDGTPQYKAISREFIWKVSGLHLQLKLVIEIVPDCSGNNVFPVSGTGETPTQSGNSYQKMRK